MLPDGGSSLDEARVRSALALLCDRGPDDEGWHAGDGVILGHRRLTIMDVSSAGHQPMSNEDGTVWLTFNGEIYRFAALRDELQALGHRFRSTSDSEVLLHGYEQWGDAVLDHVDGMFAFGLWDATRKRLLLARDRLGKKPLFWANRGGVLAFSSLVRPLVAVGVVEPAIDPGALRDYLHFNYVIGPRSIFSGLELLPAGSWLVAEGGNVRIGRYWDLKDAVAERGDVDLQQRFEDLVTDAVRARLVSDVPLGVFLSGGVDSALIAALAHRESGTKLPTFSVGFDEATYDERAKARRVAARLGSEHHEIGCAAADVPLLLPRIVASSDHLLADQSLVPLTRLAGEARRSVKVVLTGDGGDELLAGYPTYRALRVAEPYIRLVPRSLRRLAAGSSEHLPAQPGKMATATLLQRFLRATTGDIARAHACWRTIWTQDEISTIFRGSPHDTAQPEPWETYARQLVPHGDWNLVQRAVYADVRVWLVDSILAKVDRATMSHGLEARSPLLDSRLVEFSFATLLRDPRRHAGKHALRQMAAGLLGAEMSQAAKEPFQTPFADWFAGPLRGYVRDSLSVLRSTFGDAFDHERLVRVEREHAERRRNHDFKLWGLVTLAEWSRQYPGVRIAASHERPPAAQQAATP